MKLKESFIAKSKSKDGRVLFENFISLSFLQIAGYVFPLITIPYIAKIIGVDKYGELAFAASVMVYFNTISEWGFNHTATRDIAKNRDNKDKVSEIFSNVIWARLSLMLLSFILLLVLIYIIPKFKDMSALLIVTFCLIPGSIMFPEWLFQGLERMKYITILNLLSKLLFTLAIFIFLKEKSDFILQPLFISFGFILSGLIAMYYIFVKWKIKLYKPSFITIKKTIKGSTDVFVNNLMPNLYSSFSIVLLGFMGGSISTGKLDAGSKFIAVAQQLMMVISRTFFPFLSRRIDKHNLFAQFSLYISFFISFILFISAPLIIKIFYTDEFIDAILILRIMSLSIFFLTLGNVYGTNYLIIIGRERLLRNITSVCSIIGFCITIPLIYYYDYIGAALTITITRGILGFSIMYKALKVRISES